MEKTKTIDSLNMIAHDAKATLKILEMAFNGIVESPKDRDHYKVLFEKGSERLCKIIEDLLIQQKSYDRGQE